MYRPEICHHLLPVTSFGIVVSNLSVDNSTRSSSHVSRHWQEIQYTAESHTRTTTIPVLLGSCNNVSLMSMSNAPTIPSCTVAQIPILLQSDTEFNCKYTIFRAEWMLQGETMLKWSYLSNQARPICAYFMVHNFSSEYHYAGNVNERSLQHWRVFLSLATL